MDVAACFSICRPFAMRAKSYSICHVHERKPLPTCAPPSKLGLQPCDHAKQYSGLRWSRIMVHGRRYVCQDGSWRFHQCGRLIAQHTSATRASARYSNRGNAICWLTCFNAPFGIFLTSSGWSLAVSKQVPRQRPSPLEIACGPP